MAENRIEAALERARQRRKEDKRPDSTHVPTVEQVPAPRQPMPRFPELGFDREGCIAKRILISEHGARWNAGADASYRMLRTRILQRIRSNHWTTIGVTSPMQGDGKSLTTLNLALSIAREGNSNVFLIDLDMRNPTLCPSLGVVPSLEINDYLAGAGRPEDLLFSIGVDKLTLAGTITSTNQASELLATRGVERLFAYIRSIAPQPIVLIDLPPVLATDDALVVAPMVDACLLVLSEGRSRRDSAAEAIALLSEFTLAGIVLNRSRAAIKDYHYSYS
jgi:Mrp family chromosome partitioning ATPase